MRTDTQAAILRLLGFPLGFSGSELEIVAKARDLVDFPGRVADALGARWDLSADEVLEALRGRMSDLRALEREHGPRLYPTKPGRWRATFDGSAEQTVQVEAYSDALRGKAKNVRGTDLVIEVRDPRWTWLDEERVLPTKPGPWWAREPYGDLRVVNVGDVGGALYVLRSGIPVSEFLGEWLEPVEVPARLLG